MESKVLGTRIAQLRNLKVISQEELSEMIGISRPSLVQLEQGNRNIKADELKKLAGVLNFSMDEIMSEDFEVNINMSEEMVTIKQPSLRISVGDININKFKNLILYILEKCAGKPNVGETVLYKLLYFSDFNYYELYEEHLSGATYRKLPNGPVPLNVDIVLKNMVENGDLQLFKTKYFGYPQKRYMPLVEADLRVFNGAEKEVIDNVIDSLSGMTATDISLYSHEDMPWKASKDKDEIDYELVFYRTTPYSRRTYNELEDYEC
ncbi:MAG: DUF4065 domain-containing protein [Rikenellaceae bacterium]